MCGTNRNISRSSDFWLPGLGSCMDSGGLHCVENTGEKHVPSPSLKIPCASLWAQGIFHLLPLYPRNITAAILRNKHLWTPALFGTRIAIFGFLLVKNQLTHFKLLKFKKWTKVSYLTKIWLGNGNFKCECSTFYQMNNNKLISCS